MEWTTTNLVVQTLAGFAGAHCAAAALHDHRFGAIGHSIVGLIAGALSGYFLQAQALTVVTGSGSMNQPRIADVFVIEGLTGAVIGGIAMAAIGMLLEARKTKT